MRHAFFALAASAILVLGAGCGGGDDAPAIRAADLPKAVLQPPDLGAVFERFDEGKQAASEQPEGRSSDPARAGRLGGWKARYNRPGSASTEGPIVVESKADLFRGGGDAKELEALRTLQAQHPDRKLAEPDLGEDAFAWKLVQRGEPRDILTITIAWRYRGVLSTVSANGFRGGMSVADVSSLARKQQRRIEALAR